MVFSVPSRKESLSEAVCIAGLYRNGLIDLYVLTRLSIDSIPDECSREDVSVNCQADKFLRDLKRCFRILSKFSS